MTVACQALICAVAPLCLRSSFEELYEVIKVTYVPSLQRLQNGLNLEMAAAGSSRRATAFRLTCQQMLLSNGNSCAVLARQWRSFSER